MLQVVLARLGVFFQAEDGIRDIGVTGVQTCALPISEGGADLVLAAIALADGAGVVVLAHEVGAHLFVDLAGLLGELLDRKSTRLNSSHANISYAVFCLKKKNKKFQLDILDTSEHVVP